MNKLLKISLKILAIIIGTIIAFIIILVCYMIYSMNQRGKQAKQDYTTQCVICDSIQIITENQIFISFSDFEKKDIEELRFYLLRNGRIVSDTLIANYSTLANIPFTNFYKTDTILLKTKDRSYFFITDFKYQPYLCYGMFGYVGQAECRLSNEINVNGIPQSTYLSPETGIRADSLSSRFK